MTKKDDDDIKIGGDFRLGRKVDVVGQAFNPVGSNVDVIGPRTLVFKNASDTRPEPAALDDERLHALERVVRQEIDSNTESAPGCSPIEREEALSLIDEVRRHRDLLAELQEEGCPWARRRERHADLRLLRRPGSQSSRGRATLRTPLHGRRPAVSLGQDRALLGDVDVHPTQHTRSPTPPRIVSINTTSRKGHRARAVVSQLVALVDRER
jgi:hypothetical protein